MFLAREAKKIVELAKKSKENYIYNLILESSICKQTQVEVFRTMLVEKNFEEISETDIQEKIKELRKFGFSVKDKFPYKRHCVISWE